VDCPRCDSQTKTLETRRVPDGATRRRRECSECGHRFTTYERAVPETLEVIKRNGHRQPFDRDKLRSALLRASHKRVEDEARATGEVTAARIGELCLEGLAKLDRGAYLQFAGTLEIAPPELS
jgi:transcriptional repressor NrdR